MHSTKFVVKGIPGLGHRMNYTQHRNSHREAIPYREIAVAQREEIPEEQEAYDTIKAVCVSKKCYLKGEELDIMKASSMIVEDFRNGRIGKITLEMPEE